MIVDDEHEKNKAERGEEGRGANPRGGGDVDLTGDESLEGEVCPPRANGWSRQNPIPSGDDERPGGPIPGSTVLYNSRS